MAKRSKGKNPFDLSNRAKKLRKKIKHMAKPDLHILQKEVEQEMKKIRRGLV